MNRAERRRYLVLGVLFAAVVYGVAFRILAASKSVDLDARTANAAESTVALDILTAFPPKVQDRVTNRAVGNAYSFRYSSAGPGGFSSQLGAGTTAGVGAQWVWQTAQTIYSFTGSTCANDICFTKVSGPDPAPTNSPAHRVPGRTLVPNSVTVSAASLTSSLITFFSPDQLLVEVTSSVTPLANGQLGYQTTYTNNTLSPIDLELGKAPIGCCDDPDQLNCDGECVDYLWDENNCGGCGIECSEVAECGEALFCEPSTYCYYGYCYCDEGSGFGLETTPLDDTLITGGTQGAFKFARRETQVGPTIPDEGPKIPAAPLCETEPETKELAAGESLTVCSESNFLPKEVSTVLTLCGTDIPDGETQCDGGDPASSGTFMQFVPDEELPYPYPGVFLTPYQVVVNDPNGDGVLQPGETGTLFISVLNAGTESLLSPVATLFGYSLDMTDDEIDNPTSLTITQDTSAYSPDLLGVPAPEAGDCDGPALPLTPSTNVVAFEITVPADHPEDVALPLILSFSGTTALAGFGVGPIDFAFPISLGIGSVEANLSLSLTDSVDPVSPASNLTYTAQVNNAGPLPAANVRVTIDVPAALSVVSTSAPSLEWTCLVDDSGDHDVVVCDKAELAVQSLQTIEILTSLGACANVTELLAAGSVISETADSNGTDNSDTETTQVNVVAPTATILQPITDQTGTPPVTIPITVRMSSQAGSLPVVRETVSLEACLLWDGFTTGDRDGFLSDEFIQTNKYMLCQAMARCGLTTLNYPRIRAAAFDSCGRSGADDVIIRRRLLKSEVCAP